MLETKLRNTTRADRKRVLSRLEQREALHASELAATGLALSADLQAQEAATRGVEQSLRRKEAMIERRDIKLKDAEVELKDRVACGAEEMSLLLAQVEQLSVDLELKHAELCRKDAEIAQITEDLEAKDEQCSSVAVEYEKLNAKRAQYNG